MPIASQGSGAPPPSRFSRVGAGALRFAAATFALRKDFLIFPLQYGLEGTKIPTRLPIAPKGEALGPVRVGEPQILRNLSDTRPPDRGQRQRGS
jgi:hypothetical protein